MLISLDKLVKRYNMHIRGIIHVGAHECEEIEIYRSLRIPDHRVFWIEGNPQKIQQIRQKYLTAQIYHALISDTDDIPTTFHIANNGQSSSILELGTHREKHPHVQYVQSQTHPTRRLDTWIQQESIPVEHVNMMNLDIQGAELAALRGMGDYLRHIDYIYTEVNIEPLYIGCGLLHQIDTFLNSHGFQRVETQILSYGWGDALYIRKNTSG